MLSRLHHHSDSEEDKAIFDDIMGLHPNLREFVTTLASNEESDAYLNFCQMVRVCANLVRICIQIVSI